MCGGKGRGGWTAGLGGVGGTRDEYMSPQVPLPLGANQSPPPPETYRQFNNQQMGNYD